MILFIVYRDVDICLFIFKCSNFGNMIFLLVVFEFGMKFIMCFGDNLGIGDLDNCWGNGGYV